MEPCQKPEFSSHLKPASPSSAMPCKSMLSALWLMFIHEVAASCTPSATTLCMKVNLFAGETGYYEFAGHTGPSPDIEVRIGQTYVFDQSDPSNWFHPVGFAYYPDGAHGETWGGDERDEVEGMGELLYKIDGAATTCPDAGDTGLDCYEPEFFYPRSLEVKEVQCGVDHYPSNGRSISCWCALLFLSHPLQDEWSNHSQERRWVQRDTGQEGIEWQGCAHVIQD